MPRSPGEDAVVDRGLGQRRGRERRRRCRATSATNISDDARRGRARSSTSSPRSLRPRPLGAAQAPAQVVAAGGRAGGLGRRRSQPRHLALERLAGEEDLVGQALLDDLAVELGAARAARRACRARASAPSSSTTISSASAIVDRRWAMTNVVRPAMTSRSAALISCSVEASTARGRVVEDRGSAGRRAARGRSRCAGAGRR